MEKIKIRTLIDITDTGVRRPSQGNQLEQDQYRNWVTLLQCINLRAIINYDTKPQVKEQDIKGQGFGTSYKGKHRVWEFEFSPDRPDEYAGINGPTDLLKQDMNLVPVIINLTETINIIQAVFQLDDEKLTNTVIEAH